MDREEIYRYSCMDVYDSFFGAFFDKEDALMGFGDNDMNDKLYDKVSNEVKNQVIEDIH